MSPHGGESDETQNDRYESLFARLDVNGTGNVDYTTLKKAFENDGHPLKGNDEAIDVLFKAMDVNGDSVIDINDFKTYVRAAEAQIRMGFQKIDADNDGRIKPSEVSNYLSTLNEKTDFDKHTPDNGTTNPPSKFSNFVLRVFHGKKNPIRHEPSSDDKKYITYDQWRDFLLFVPRKQGGSRLQTAYFYLFKEDVDLSSEGDMTLINDFLRGFGFFVAGGISGVVSRTCTAPFDRLKVFLIARADLSSTLLNSKRDLIVRKPTADVSKIRSPIVKAVISLYRQGGIRAFYVGNGLSVFKVFPESSMKFGSFELTKRILSNIEGTNGDTTKLSKVSTYLAGGIAGVAAQFSVYPVDTLKYRIQCAPLDTPLKGNRLLVATAKEMYKEGGIRLFYRGITVGIMGIFPYAAFDLGTFSALKKWYISSQARALKVKEQDISISNLVLLPMGAFSGTVGATIVYPINLLRTRLQAQGTYAHPYRYNGFKDVLVKTVHREGYQGLYKGLVPTLAKVCPAVSISYLCYENLKKLMTLE